MILTISFKGTQDNEKGRMGDDFVPQKRCSRKLEYEEGVGAGRGGVWGMNQGEPWGATGGSRVNFCGRRVL